MKTIMIIPLLFLVSCVSDKHVMDKGLERVKNMTNEERTAEGQKCVRMFQIMVDRAENEETYCTFWKCTYGKEFWRAGIERCKHTYNSK